jgi:hypothetical protein
LATGVTRQTRRIRPRLVAFYLLVVLFCLMQALLTPLPFMVLGWFLDETIVSHRIHETVFGFAFFISLVALLYQFRGPERKPAAMYMVAIPIWLLALGVVVVDQTIDPVVLLFMIVPVFLILLHPARSQILHPAINREAALLALTAVAAVPLVVFAFTEFRTGFDAAAVAKPVFEDLPTEASDKEIEQALDDATENAAELEVARHYGHWSAMGGVALTIVVLGAVASLRPGGGWRLVAWGAGAAPIVYGVASLAATKDASAAHPIWAVLAILWGIAFIAVTERVARPTSEPAGPAYTSRS